MDPFRRPLKRAFPRRRQLGVVAEAADLALPLHGGGQFVPAILPAVKEAA